MRIQIFVAVLLRSLNIDRLLFHALAAHAANCVERERLSLAVSTLEWLERFLYLSRSTYLILTQYRLASLYEKAFRMQEATILYEGLLRRRISMTMSGNIRVRLEDIQQGRSRFGPPRSGRRTPASEAKFP
ncbi:MAG: hypothetical protein ABIY70_09995 [Capsulimonas sp.]|uniref:hypothetical protein n=1 Tax=Capsulimonas sp. TaxID=2494211 RepID=UPI003264DBCC